MIKKKKIHTSTREILRTQVKLSDFISQAMLRNGTLSMMYSQALDFVSQIDSETAMIGQITVNVNQFVEMPRGKVSLQIVGASNFSKDENMRYEGLVFKLSKQMSKENE
jgi:hypothetical protein